MQLKPEKIVEFNEYCKQCKYRDLPETEDPCYDCLADPTNTFSHRPTMFKERTNK